MIFLISALLFIFLYYVTYFLEVFFLHFHIAFFHKLLWSIFHSPFKVCWCSSHFPVFLEVNFFFLLKHTRLHFTFIYPRRYYALYHFAEFSNFAGILIFSNRKCCQVSAHKNERKIKSPELKLVSFSWTFCKFHWPKELYGHFQ